MILSNLLTYLGPLSVNNIVAQLYSYDTQSFFFYAAVTVQLVSMTPSGGIGSPNQLVQENGANPVCCAQLLQGTGATIKRNIVVTISTGTGTATGRACC